VLPCSLFASLSAWTILIPVLFLSAFAFSCP
jgi:hypothetical protein